MKPEDQTAATALFSLSVRRHREPAPEPSCPPPPVNRGLECHLALHGLEKERGPGRGQEPPEHGGCVSGSGGNRGARRLRAWPPSLSCVLCPHSPCGHPSARRHEACAAGHGAAVGTAWRSGCCERLPGRSRASATPPRQDTPTPPLLPRVSALLICGARGAVPPLEACAGDKRRRADARPSRLPRSAGLTAEAPPPDPGTPALSPLPRARRLRPRAVTALASQDGVPTRVSPSLGGGGGAGPRGPA